MVKTSYKAKTILTFMRKFMNLHTAATD